MVELFQLQLGIQPLPVNITGIVLLMQQGLPDKTFGNLTWNNAGQTTATGAINGI